MFGKIKKKLLLVAHRVSGAPLVSSTLMARQHMVRHYYIVVAHHMSGAPLVAIPSIALFLVVWLGKKRDYVHHACTSSLRARPPPMCVWERDMFFRRVWYTSRRVWVLNVMCAQTWVVLKGSFSSWGPTTESEFVADI